MAALPQEEGPQAAARQKSNSPQPGAQEKSNAAPLSAWLQLMLAEIARKRAELDSARAETARRELERAADEARGTATGAGDARGS